LARGGGGGGSKVRRGGGENNRLTDRHSGRSLGIKGTTSLKVKGKKKKSFQGDHKTPSFPAEKLPGLKESSGWGLLQTKGSERKKRIFSRNLGDQHQGTTEEDLEGSRKKKKNF